MDLEQKCHTAIVHRHGANILSEAGELKGGYTDESVTHRQTVRH